MPHGSLTTLPSTSSVSPLRSATSIASMMYKFWSPYCVLSSPWACTSSFCRVLRISKGLRALATVSPVLGPNHVILGWFSNRTGTSVDDWKARGKDYTRLLVPNLPLCYWSSHLFDLRAPSSSDAPVLLLNQPIVQRLDEQSLVLQVGDWLGQSPVPIHQEQYRNLEYYKSLSFGPLSWLS